MCVSDHTVSTYHLGRRHRGDNNQAEQGLDLHRSALSESVLKF